MEREAYIEIPVPIPLERYEQTNSNLRELLATGGGYLLDAYQEVQEKLHGIQIDSSFFISVWPDARRGERAFLRQIPEYLLEQEYCNYFPWITTGLVLERGWTNTQDINQATITFGQYPVVKVQREGWFYPVTRFEVEYPLVVSLPKREVLEPIWNKFYCSKGESCGLSHTDRVYRTGFQRFSELFSQDVFPGDQYPQATVLDPKWNNNKDKLFEMLVPCLAAVVGQTFTQSVDWGYREVNRGDERRLGLSKKYTLKGFQQLVEQIRQDKRAQSNPDVIGIFLES
ncbi:MAG: hypothetical protein V1810_04105 [Candidatus Beckwithbacteria bacterium]